MKYPSPKLTSGPELAPLPSPSFLMSAFIVLLTDVAAMFPEDSPQILCISQLREIVLKNHLPRSPVSRSISRWMPGECSCHLTKAKFRSKSRKSPQKVYVTQSSCTIAS
ncbi:hypothetical protein DL95DRAFT_380666 [Leptodontidium sp. 2 PMI_412]|nr:hypothetical protein DL95DRAFT_380666 [Leptodontidium sp. 2 PMI_412]